MIDMVADFIDEKRCGAVAGVKRRISNGLRGSASAKMKVLADCKYDYDRRYILRDEKTGCVINASKGGSIYGMVRGMKSEVGKISIDSMFMPKDAEHARKYAVKKCARASAIYYPIGRIHKSMAEQIEGTFR